MTRRRERKLHQAQVNEIFNLLLDGNPDLTDRQIEARAELLLADLGYECSIRTLNAAIRDAQHEAVSQFVPQHGPAASLTMSS